MSLKPTIGKADHAAEEALFLAVERELPKGVRGINTADDSLSRPGMARKRKCVGHQALPPRRPQAQPSRPQRQHRDP